MDIEDHLFFLCTQVVERRDRALGAALRPLGLLSTEWRVLGTLDARGPLTMQELADWTAFERTRLTRILHNMEARQWIRRESPPVDRRAVVVCLAPKGRALFRKAEVRVERLNAEILGAVAAPDLVATRRSLKSMRQLLIDLGV